jgi:hypothetical protein
MDLLKQKPFKTFSLLNVPTLSRRIALYRFKMGDGQHSLP